MLSSGNQREPGLYTNNGRPLSMSDWGHQRETLPTQLIIGVYDRTERRSMLDIKGQPAACSTSISDSGRLSMLGGC